MIDIFKFITIYFSDIISNIIYLIPKNTKTILFIGKNDGLFVDNIKYLYLYKSNLISKKDKFFLTFNKNIANDLSNKIDNVIYVFSFRGIYLILTSKYLVFDNLTWSLEYKGILYFLTKGMIKIQLWHGYPIKKIEYHNIYDKTMQRCKKRLSIKDFKFYFSYIKRCIKYDYLLIPSTSAEIKTIFNVAFDYKKAIFAGYPRNEYLIDNSSFDIIDTDNIHKQFNIKIGIKIIAFLPTFRDNNSIILDNNMLEHLNEYAKNKDYIFVIKPHPWDYNLEKFLDKYIYSNIIKLKKDIDIYPYLNSIDILISDISSIMFDFLLLDKPIIHYFPDRDEYFNKQRDSYYKLEDIQMGELCLNIEEVIKAIENIELKDLYKKKRDIIKERIFGDIEHNCNLIYKEILNV